MLRSAMAQTHDPASRSFAPASGGTAADPLSDVLQTVRLNGALFFRVEASCPWCVDVPEAGAFQELVLPGSTAVVSYHVVTAGIGWVMMAGEKPVRFEAGDVLIFAHGDAYSLKSDPEAPPEYPADATVAFLGEMAAGRLPFDVMEGGGAPPRTRYVCGYLGCDAGPFNPVLDALPAFLRVKRSTAGPDLLDRLLDFALAPDRGGPGSAVVRLRLCELVFIEALRRHLSSLPASSSGWLAGLRDPMVGRALALLHAEPAQPWTVADLARAAGTSRAVLAARFAERVGMPPIQYLANWRMQCAVQKLAAPGARVASIAHEVGYESEAAFCRAFKKVTGVPPAQWQKRATRRLLPWPGSPAADRPKHRADRR